MKIDYPMIRILRMNEDEQAGTFGALVIQEKPFCVCLEPPNNLNDPFKSSIPVGQYFCRKYHSSKYGNTFEVKGVPGRAYILFHAGNVVGHTSGCIILAQYWGKLYGDRAVLNSGNTFKEFMEAMGPYDRFHLTIKEFY
ncbi:MAG: DUF5675 family protein [Thermodesulfobacteriota bacterium]|nr:DUF5675 family protein [Thermodesulfobacteriota bacterium]